MEETKKEITQETEEEKIARLKEKYGEVYTLTFADGVKAYFHTPDRKVLDLVYSKSSEPMYAHSILFEKTLIKISTSANKDKTDELTTKIIPVL